MKRLLAAIAVIGLFTAILSASILHTSYDAAGFRDFQIRRNIAKEAGVTQELLDRIDDDLVRYMQSGKEEYLTPYFNAREVAHMRDVYGLYVAAKALLAGGALAFVACSFVLFRRDRAGYFRSMRTGLIIAVLFMGAVGLVASMWFSGAFTLFHELLFRNDLWILNPETDLMIRMMPLDFFMGLAVTILVKFLTATVIAIVLFHVCHRFFLSGESRESR